MRRIHLKKRTAVQLAVLAVVVVAASASLGLYYMQLPQLLFGAGQYDVTVQLPESGGLYVRGNVTYLGTEVGQVKSVGLTDHGVAAVLSLNDGISIPSDVDAQVHSQTAVGEQYVELVPHNGASPPLKRGDVIPQNRTSVPPDINAELDSANRGLQAIPHGNLKTVIDETYTAFGGLGPELSRLVKGSTSLAIGARKNLDDLINLTDNGAPLLDAHTDTADSLRAWAAHMATITGQLQAHDSDIRGILQRGAPAAAEGRQLLDRLQPALPTLLANMATVAPALDPYQAGIEQLLVLTPMAIQASQGSTIAGSYGAGAAGLELNFNLNLNVPPPCATGFLPPQQIRSASAVDYPDRPAGDLYCRRPQDSQFDVRGARNIPCETRPGKRAPTVAMCESDENYVPLNDGFNWKGDPNATLSGQDVPQVFPGRAPSPHANPAGGAPPPPPAVTPNVLAAVDATTPDGKTVTHDDPIQQPAEGKTWQSMLVPAPAP